MTPGSRHDQLSLWRQQRLAGVLIVTNLAIVAASALIIAHYDWSLGLTPTERLLWALAFAITLVALLIASGFLEWLSDSLGGFGQAGTRSQPGRVQRFIARRRMVFYYAGVWANMIAIALVTETTGGLAASPFVPLFVAFVLTGQQLSRFRTQALNLLWSGLIIAGALLVCHSLATEPPAPAPDELPIAMVVLALLMGGVLNISERPHNYMLRAQVPPPSHVRIYRDGEGVWRFAFFLKRHAQDPVLLAHDSSSVPEGDFPPELRERLEEHAREMGKHGKWKNTGLEWPATFAQSFTIELVTREDVPKDESS